MGAGRGNEGAHALVHSAAGRMDEMYAEFRKFGFWQNRNKKTGFKRPGDHETWKMNNASSLDCGLSQKETAV